MKLLRKYVSDPAFYCWEQNSQHYDLEIFHFRLFYDISFHYENFIFQTILQLSYRY